MARCVAPPALSARISGDRLAALIPNAAIAAATDIAENIRAAAAAIVPRAGQGSFEVSACIGVAPVGRSENALAHALATAEIACKAAKDRGRNRVEVFQDSDQSIIRRHTDILVDRQAPRGAWPTTASGSMRSPFCRCAATTDGRASSS